MLKKFILAVTFLAIPVYCSVLVPPDEYFLAGMMTLSIPVFTLLLIASFVYFTDRKSKWMFLPAGILCFAFPIFSSSFSFISSAPVSGPSLRVLTHNMNALQYYQNPSSFGTNRQSFQSWAAGKNFDILCLQEMVEVQRDSFLMPGYYRSSSVKNTRDGDNLGLFIFSRFPILREGKIEFAFNSFNRLMWADVVAGGDTVRVVNVHLVSYDFYPNSVRKNLGKIKAALRARSWHAKLISKFLEESKYPVILCGDLNETPVSYPYRKINKLLHDTYAGSGAVFHYTYRFAGFPIRIDHMFTSKKLKSSGYTVEPGATWSDHSPVSVQIQLPTRD